MGAPGWHVDPDALDATARAVADGIREQDAVPLDAEIDDAAVGHVALGAALAELCARWAAGLDLLTADGEAVAETLHRVATAYREADAVAAAGFTDPGVAAVDG